MSLGFVSLLVLAVGGALAIAALVLAGISAGRRLSKASPEPPPMPTSLSFLAGLSFFCGLGAILLVAITALFSQALSMRELLEMDSDVRAGLDLAGRIVLYVALLPAVAAVAFALGARGVISESQGAVRGRPLYRTGLLMAVVTGVIVLQSGSGFPAIDWPAGKGNRNQEELNRGYLGVETGTLDHTAGSPILRVVPGSPADRAGLKAGDILLKIDGTPVHQLPPLGSPASSSWSSTDPYVASYIASARPGVKMAIQVRRGKETLTVVAELSASFSSLLALLEKQSFDTERLDVLKAAGLDRRYSADELTKICESFTFDEGRLTAIEAALPQLQDPQNAFRILGALEFSGSKSKAGGWIEKLPRTPK